jgi:hypothetical protein
MPRGRRSSQIPVGRIDKNGNSEFMMDSITHVQTVNPQFAPPTPPRQATPPETQKPMNKKEFVNMYLYFLCPFLSIQNPKLCSLD